MTDITHTQRRSIMLKKTPAKISLSNTAHNKKTKRRSNRRKVKDFDDAIHSKRSSSLTDKIDEVPKMGSLIDTMLACWDNINARDCTKTAVSLILLPLISDLNRNGMSVAKDVVADLKVYQSYVITEERAKLYDVPGYGVIDFVVTNNIESRKVVLFNTCSFNPVKSGLGKLIVHMISWQRLITDDTMFDAIKGILWFGVDGRCCD